MTKHFIELRGHHEPTRDLANRSETDSIMDQITDDRAAFNLLERMTVMPEFEGP